VFCLEVVLLEDPIYMARLLMQFFPEAPIFCAWPATPILDHDFVPAEIYHNVKPGTVIPQDTVELEQFPSDFNPLNLLDTLGRSNLPMDPKLLSEFDVFCLFVNDIIIKLLVDATNQNATHV
jgi:hypothetical protein